MPAAALPEDEDRRIASLRNLQALDSEPSPALDAITRAACLVCGVPIALISLVDADRQWFKSNIGLPGVTETPRELAFCAHAILQDDLLDVPDATSDERFAANPLVQGAPYIRSYLGAPLILKDGTKAGTLCMIDQQPRHFTPTQRDILRELAIAATCILERLRLTRMLEDTTVRLRDSEEFLAHTGALVGVGGWSFDLITGKLAWTAETHRIHGVGPDYEPDLESAIAFYAPEARPVIRAALESSMRTGEGWDLELPFVQSGGTPIWVRAKGQVTKQAGIPVKLTGALQNITERVEREHALRTAQQRASLAMNSGKIGVWDLNFATGSGYWSPQMFELYGLPPMPAPPPISQWPGILHPEDRDHAMRALRDAYTGIAPENLEFRVLWQDGSVHHLRVSATVTFDDQGRPASLIGVTWDVTEPRQLAEKLANQHELMRVTLESIGDGVITTDAAGRTAWMNPVAERMTGWTVAEAQGRPLTEIFHIVNEDTREPAPNPVEICLQEGRIVGLANHTILISRHGEEFGIEDSASPIRAESGETLGVVLVFHDVTAQRQLAGEMTHRATHDSLTGLLNRAEFEVRLRYNLHTAQTDKKQSVMLYLDLDQFKLVNDTCGHGAGDMLLRHVARLLSDLVRKSDSVARLGGDEFAILLDHCTVEQAQPLAQKICERMEDFRFTHDGKRFRVGASIGLVPVDERWPEPAGIMQAADACCYAAKEAGRNRVHPWSDTDKAMNARHGQAKWASRLAQALDEDRFVLFAQRIKALQTPHGAKPPGIHAEVLLRKVARDGSLILPGAFLPAAERFHIVSRIDRWVLDRAITWMNAVPSLETIDMLAVNLSGQSVGDAAFQAWAISRLAQAGPRICERLCLEITETAVVTSLVDAAHFNEQARDLGVRVALDDFGAGASSFGYLKTLPIDILKIDGQFVRDLLSDPLDQAAVRSFTDIARVAGLRTIAEFVDSDAVMAKLRDMGVDYAQGYLIHKPAPIDELLVTVRQKEAALF